MISICPTISTLVILIAIYGATGAGLSHASHEPAAVGGFQRHEGCSPEGSTQASSSDLLDAAQPGGSVQCIQVGNHLLCSNAVCPKLKVLAIKA